MNNPEIRHLTFLTTLMLAAAFLTAPAATRADTLYVPYPDGRTIETFDSATGADLGAFATITSVQAEPAGLAFDSTSNLYVANEGNRTIEKFTPAGVGSVFAAGPDDPLLVRIHYWRMGAHSGPLSCQDQFIRGMKFLT